MKILTNKEPNGREYVFSCRTEHSSVNKDDPISQKLEQMFASHYSWQRQDLIWILESIKKKVAEKDPNLLSLSQPRLLKNFHCFAEIAMMLIHHRNVNDQELDRLKTWVYEACYGLNHVDEPF